MVTQADRAALRMQSMMRQMQYAPPLFPGLPPIDPVVRAARAAAVAPAGAVTAETVYEPQPLHFMLPHGIWMLEATSVAVDSADNVFVFNRGNMPILVFDPEGQLINYWGNKTPFDGTATFTDPYGSLSHGP
jgi:hypothetical protein